VNARYLIPLGALLLTCVAVAEPALAVYPPRLPFKPPHSIQDKINYHGKTPEHNYKLPDHGHKPVLFPPVHGKPVIPPIHGHKPPVCDPGHGKDGHGKDGHGKDGHHGKFAGKGPREHTKQGQTSTNDNSATATATNNPNGNGTTNPNQPDLSGLAGLGSALNGLGSGLNGLGGSLGGFSGGSGGGFSPSSSGGYTGPADAGYGTQAALPFADASPPPQPAADNPDDANTAWLTLQLPDKNAEVSLNGVKMAHKGNPRRYVTPKLDPALVYHYDVQVKWPGKTYNTKIRFTAGDEIVHVVPRDGIPKDNAPANPPPMPAVDPKPAPPAPPGAKADDAKVDDAKAGAKLKLAKELLKDKPEKGKEWLLDIIVKFPQSKAAAEAKQLLVK
jgi:hypothetical protein